MSSLSSPLKLSSSLSLRNRSVMSALTRNRAVPTNVPNDVMEEYYVQRAKGGVGLIVAEGTLIVQQGTEWPNAPGIWNKDHVKEWKKITDAVHKDGSLIFCQLWHLGRVSHPDAPEQKESGRPVYGPSAVAANGGKFRFIPGTPGYVTPTALEDPTLILDDYERAAVNAKEAGFDGVELHGANGYLVHQFLDHTANKRTDQWGGSVENRARFGIEALKRLIKVWGADRVSLKLSPGGGYNDLGMPLQDTLDTFSYFAKEAIALGISYITWMRYDSTYDPTHRGTAHNVIKSYKKLFTGSQTKFFANAGLTPKEADQLIANGDIDAAVFGALWLGYPNLQNSVAKGNLDFPFNLDVPNLYGHGPGTDIRKGYTDYPLGPEEARGTEQDVGKVANA